MTGTSTLTGNRVGDERSADPSGGGRRPGRRGPRRPPGLPWILPALVLSVGLIYYGIGYTGYISTLDWDGVSPDPGHLGLQNYTRIVHDPVFWAAVRHTVVFFVVTFVIQTVLGLVFAVLLHAKVRLAAIYKVIVFVPVVLAPAIMAPVFRHMFAPDGELNWVLDHVGLGSLAQPWIGQTSTALPVIMFITIWEWTGLTFVLYYAAMTQIDPSILEAARMDGAGNLRTLISIIWPEMRGTTVALAILGAIGALKTFDVPYLVTIGGPNYATEFLGTYIYRQTIPLSHVGYGAALSIILLVVALIMALVLQFAGRERGAGD
ncbi:sugar ABC transporter permease [Actinoplanes sp. TBRC 11911]|uniref:carbohydrate ABC transporter permease n=1 Tax=Actinoplanes sp. TBRC 11911 TaxID=2729386 RepID=UPI00145C4C24|nr:sugar ABC transporter permease [Actinoplanes sp. TBRC 11911]NMO49903.1 sugar ABC transporter permease [Actinoplanes sp. TBRC 11911]